MKMAPAPLEIEQLGDIAVVVRDQDKMPFAYGGLWLKTGEICGVYVAPEFRGKGVEKLIVKHLTEVAEVHHIPRLHIKVRMSNPRLSRWLIRLGVRRFDWFEIDVPKALQILHGRRAAGGPDIMPEITGCRKSTV